MTFERQHVTTWEARLQRAYTTEDVVAVARDFIATWSPGELGVLPEHLRPGRFRDSDDVGLYAFRLASCPDTSGGNARILQRMTTFFAAASRRLSEIFAIAAAEAARAREEERMASRDSPEALKK